MREKTPRLLLTKVESPGTAVKCLLWCNWIQPSEAELSIRCGHSDFGCCGGDFSEHPDVFIQAGCHDDCLPSILEQRRGLMDGTPTVMWLANQVSIIHKGGTTKGPITKHWTEPTFSTTFRSNSLRVKGTWLFEWEQTWGLAGLPLFRICVPQPEPFRIKEYQAWCHKPVIPMTDR